MKIYHYTSLDNLALILSHRTLRFNRLDRMDDPCERRFFSIGLDWSPYTYVSCWTETHEENIPLWHMYAKEGVGVRICLDKDCIDWENVLLSGFRLLDKQIKQPPGKNSGIIHGIEYNPFSIYGGIGVENCYHQIKYIDETHFDSNVRIGGGHTLINKELAQNEFQKYIGLYKDKKWAFQNETRFRLFCVPKYSEEETAISFETFQQIVSQKCHNPFLYIDLPLKETSFENMEITFGPNASESTITLLKLLKKEFAPSATLRPSILNDGNWRFL